jgi:hypothetical protein
MAYPEKFKFKLSDDMFGIEYLATKESADKYKVSWEFKGSSCSIKMRSMDVTGNLLVGDWVEIKEKL